MLIRNSFLNKLLSGIIGILILTLLTQSFLQNRFYPTYFKYQVMHSIETVIDEIPLRMSLTETLAHIEKITSETGTISTIVYSEDYQNGLNSIPSIQIEDNAGNQYKVFVPKLPTTIPETDAVISGSFFRSTNGQFYVPAKLEIDGQVVYGQRNQVLAQQLGEFTDVIDTSKRYPLEGKLVDYSVISLTDSTDVLLNQELINITTRNTYDILQLDNGFRYVSKDVYGNDENLVYLTKAIIDGKSQIILTIYPLSTINYITWQMARINVFVISVAAMFIITTVTLFSRRVSKPLVHINKATQNFANFDFSLIPEYESDDEIGTLSRNINKLSTSLHTTLTELQEKNQALSASLELETEREQTRKDFVEGISHELKTPLAVIQATNEALSLGLIPKDETSEYYETIKKEVAKSNKIMQDMMSVYQIDQADYTANWTVFSMKDLITQSLESHIILADTKNIKIKQTIFDEQIKGDFEKLSLVVNNLLSNAVKYAPQQTEITVKHSDGYFEITNDGDIPEDSLSSLFEPFYRVDKARARQDGSTGLGLYIVKQILTQHQATYGVTSDFGKVKFYFQLKRLIP